MSKRRNGVDKAIESVQNKILALKMALEELEQQRGDAVVPPPLVTRRHRARPTPSTINFDEPVKGSHS
jgi:hypothetical protein